MVKSKNVIEEAVRHILLAASEDPNREGLQRTPQRVAKMFDEILSGYHVDVDSLVNNALFDAPHDEMIVVKNIEYFSLCEHHLLPFFGRVHVAYIPGNKIIGLSKIARIVDMFARRLQVQERLTRQIAELMDEILHPSGVAVVVEGLHTCAMMHSVSRGGAGMVTSMMLGSFKDDLAIHDEFFRHLQRVDAASF